MTQGFLEVNHVFHVNVSYYNVVIPPFYECGIHLQLLQLNEWLKMVKQGAVILCAFNILQVSLPCLSIHICNFSLIGLIELDLIPG